MSLGALGSLFGGGWSTKTRMEMGNTTGRLFDFPFSNGLKEWFTVHDGVMGGRSQGLIHPSEEGTLVFEGTLSLENGGGFASIRSKPNRLRLLHGDGICVRVLGDGRTYSVNLYPDRSPIAFSFRAPLPTTQGTWTEKLIPFGNFEATSFGRVVSGYGPVKPETITALGFLLGDKKAGPFRLEVAWIDLAGTAGNG